MAESALAPPGPIPNPVVTHRSAGEYCGGDPVGGEAAAGTSARLSDSRPFISPSTNPFPTTTTRGGAAAARWAHNPKVGGSNPSPATTSTTLTPFRTTDQGSRHRDVSPFSFYGNPVADSSQS